MNEKSSRATYQVLGMSCVSCAKLIRKSLEKHEGVKDINVNAMTNTFYIDYDPNKIADETLEKAIKETGYKAIRLQGMKQ